MGNCDSKFTNDIETILKNVNIDDLQSLGSALISLYNVWTKLSKNQQVQVMKLSQKYIENTKNKI